METMQEADSVTKGGAAWLPCCRTLSLRSGLLLLLLLGVFCFLYLPTSVVHDMAARPGVWSVVEMDKEHPSPQSAPRQEAKENSSSRTPLVSANDDTMPGHKAGGDSPQDKTHKELIPGYTSANISRAKGIFSNCGLKHNSYSDTAAGAAVKGDEGFPDQCQGPELTQAKTDPSTDLTTLAPLPFLPEFRNPCWRKAGSATGDLRCLPFAYLAGFPKCGSSDLYRRLVLHPDLVKARKEPHWITRERFMKYKSASFEYYSSIYGNKIQKSNSNNSISVDGSASTAWDNNQWYKFPGNQNCSEPCVITADYIRHLNPDVKIVMILRNPTSRLYSEFMYFKTTSRERDGYSQEKFHEDAETTINKIHDCLKQRSLRHCAYNMSRCYTPTRLMIGVYTVFIEDWLLRYPRDQILVVRLEDMSTDPVGETAKVYKFLDLDLSVMTPEFEQKLQNLPPQNMGKRSRKKGPMLSKTRRMLDNFYAPFNQRLAAVLGDDKYTWTDV